MIHIHMNVTVTKRPIPIEKMHMHCTEVSTNNNQKTSLAVIFIQSIEDHHSGLHLFIEDQHSS